MTKSDILNIFEETYKNDGMPNLSGKIIGLFYVSDSKFLTFNDFINVTKASKSKVSKTLKQLIILNRIKEVDSKNDKRKKLYQLDIKGLINFMNFIILNYEQQNKILIASKHLRQGNYPEMDVFLDKSIAFNNEMLTFLKQKSEAYFT